MARLKYANNRANFTHYPRAVRELAVQLAAAEQSQQHYELRTVAGSEYGGLGRMKIAYRRAFTDGDMTLIPGFDQYADAVKQCFPWVCDSQHLFELLRDNEPDPRASRRHYEAAAKILAEANAAADEMLSGFEPALFDAF